MSDEVNSENVQGYESNVVVGKHRGRPFGLVKKLVVGIVLLGVVVFAALLALGYLTVVWKQPSQPAAQASRICTDKDVTTYNTAALYRPSASDSTKYVVDEATLKKLEKDIKGRSGHHDDPTCQSILLLAAVRENDYSAAKIAYDTLQTLHEQYLYVDSNLNMGGSLQSYENIIRTLSTDKNDNTTQEPQGGG